MNHTANAVDVFAQSVTDKSTESSGRSSGGWRSLLESVPGHGGGKVFDFKGMSASRCSLGWIPASPYLPQKIF